MLTSLNNKTLNKQSPDHRFSLLNLRRLPARLTVLEAAVILGLQENDIPILVRAGLLKPLGNPAPNAHKYFAACQMEQLSADPDWLSKVTTRLSRYWRNKNQRNTKSDGAARDESGQGAAFATQAA